MKFGTGPKPSGPTHPVPTGPGPGRAEFDLLFTAVDAVLDDLKTPARRDPSSAAVGADAIATPGGPVRLRVGEPPLPGADFRLPRDVRGPLLDALNRRAD